MSALTKREIDDGLIAALRAIAPGEKPDQGAIRAAIGCTGTELRLSIQRLQMQGKLVWNRLELAPSMLLQAVAARAVVAPEDAVAAVAEAEPGHGIGPALLADIEAYCARTGTSEGHFGAVLFRHPGFVALLRKRGTLRHDTDAAARLLMADHPDGLRDIAAPNTRVRRPKPDKVPARPSVAAEVEREAAELGDRRREARMLSGAVHPLPSPSLVERIQTALAEEPEDLIKAVRRKHPQIWSRVLLLGRAIGESPATALYRALEAGLDAAERAR